MNYNKIREFGFAGVFVEALACQHSQLLISSIKGGVKKKHFSVG
jgi:hypothetical protein